MTFRNFAGATALCLTWLFVSHPLPAQEVASAYRWLDEISRELKHARELAARGQLTDAQSATVRVYLDRFEALESYYGNGGTYHDAALAAEVTAGESAFHLLLRSDNAVMFGERAKTLEVSVTRIRTALQASGLPATPEVERSSTAAAELVPAETAATGEIKNILRELSQAAEAYRGGNVGRARALVEHAYLEGFEPLESRLPADLVDRIEKRIHLELRPAINRNAPVTAVTGMIGALGTDLSSADQFLARGGVAQFAAVNSFVIVVREGLEAVLLIAALLAYLSAIGAESKHRRQIYAGVLTGIIATGATWVAARTLIPISGANRELLEGVTALLAVIVLLYVAHWLFQKTYIHDWKDYLRSRVGGAVTRGSSLALAALAFAAVYREGFETVLFYQALTFDAGVTAVLSGFVPGLLLIVLVGFGIIRAGLRLPLKKVFAGTNAILMYLAFVFVGKGVYNLQEAGLFAPHPLSLPDYPVLRQLLGLFPLVETIATQACLLTLLCATYVWYRMRSSARVPRTVPLPEPRVSARPASRDNHRTPPVTPSDGPPRARAQSGR
jgi:high-affinity iron transporter